MISSCSLKYQLIRGRLALVRGDAGRAAASGRDLEAAADRPGVPCCVSAARLLRHRAGRRLALPADLDQGDR